MNFKIIPVIILACLALVFVAQNIDIVSLKFFYWEIAMSRAVLIFFPLLIGFMIGWFLKSYLSYRKKKKEVQNILNK